MHPSVTITILNYNRAELLPRALRSCLSQIVVRRQIEIIVVDDASTDNSTSVVKQFDPDIMLIENEKNLGPGASSQKALEASSTDYWVRVDSDDFLSPFACGYMAELLDVNPQVDYVYSDFYRIDAKGYKQELFRLEDFDQHIEHGAGVLFRRKALMDVGGYDPGLRHWEDMDLLLRFAAESRKGFHLPVPLYRYYQHESNISNTPERVRLRREVRSRYGR